jgi:hypothetical protein
VNVKSATTSNIQFPNVRRQTAGHARDRCFRKVEDRLLFFILVGVKNLLRGRIWRRWVEGGLREETPSPALCFDHFSEFTFLPFMSVFRFSLQIIPKTLFDDRPVLEDIYKALGSDLGKIV